VIPVLPTPGFGSLWYVGIRAGGSPGPWCGPVLQVGAQFTSLLVIHDPSAECSSFEGVDMNLLQPGRGQAIVLYEGGGWPRPLRSGASPGHACDRCQERVDVLLQNPVGQAGVRAAARPDTLRCYIDDGSSRSLLRFCWFRGYRACCSHSSLPGQPSSKVGMPRPAFQLLYAECLFDG